MSDASDIDSTKSNTERPPPFAVIVGELSLLAIAIIFVGVVFRSLIYPALGVPEHAPIPARPVVAFGLAWFFLRKSGGDWSSLGLSRPKNWGLAIAAAGLLYLLLTANSKLLTPLIAEVFEPDSTPSILGYVKGNIVALLGWLGIAWGVGAFCEELFFRGFLLRRVAGLFKNTRLGLAVGILVQALLFGCLHLYAGAFGFAFAFVAALIFGVGYLLAGRNLWPSIIVHGIWNSVGLIGLYLS